MRSLTSDISDKGAKSPTAKRLPSTQISSLRYRTSNMISDDEDQGDSAQEGDSSMSEDDNLRHRRLAVSDIYGDPVLHITEAYKNNRTKTISCILLCLISSESLTAARDIRDTTPSDRAQHAEQIYTTPTTNNNTNLHSLHQEHKRGHGQRTSTFHIFFLGMLLQQYFILFFGKSTHLHLAFFLSFFPLFFFLKKIPQLCPSVYEHCDRRTPTVHHLQLYHDNSERRQRQDGRNFDQRAGKD